MCAACSCRPAPLLRARRAAPQAPDSYGRVFPGNKAEASDTTHVQCWEPRKSIKVRIVDVCPCYYCPETGG